MEEGGSLGVCCGGIQEIMVDCGASETFVMVGLEIMVDFGGSLEVWYGGGKRLWWQV